MMEDEYSSVITLPSFPWMDESDDTLNEQEANIISWLTRKGYAIRPAGIARNCGIPDSLAINCLASMAGRGLITETKTEDGRLWYAINEVCTIAQETTQDNENAS